MKDIIDWNDIKHNGKKTSVCPACSHTRKKKTDKCMRVDHDKGLAFCHHCNVKAFKEDGNKQTLVDYNTPPQNEIKVSSFNDKVLSYISSRKINSSTLEALYVSQEKYYQPALKKEVDNILFNYYEGSILINKKYRSADKKFTQTAGTKPIFYNINSIMPFKLDQFFTQI
jgi:twinkle protein